MKCFIIHIMKTLKVNLELHFTQYNSFDIP